LRTTSPSWPKLFPPPARLRAIPERWARVLRSLWILLFTFAVVADVAAALYVVRATYELSPVFTRAGLDHEVQYRGDVRVGTLPRADGSQVVPTKAHVVAIDGQRISAQARFAELADRLQAAPGPAIAVDLLMPDGSIKHLEQQRSDFVGTSDARRDRDLRMTVRLTFALLACASLLACSLILALRRPSDPVAMLFAFAFAGMAATIDPPLQMWMGLGWAAIEDVLSAIWFYLLLIALAVFPDGIFVPSFYRWLLPFGIALAIFVSLPNVDENLQVFLGIGALLAMLVGQVRRFRRCPPGIERQQIKWAAFGFAAGLLLILAAFIVVLFIPDDPAKQVPMVNLAALVLFSLGMAVIPLGLLVALTRYRLWEADTVISRSAAYAVVTLIVGMVWAASSDLVKLVITEVLGRQSEAGATTVGAIIAAGIFSPTQSVVLGWTRRRFGGPVNRIEGAAQRLKTWGLTETPTEVATRALSIIDDAVHPSAAAIVIDTAAGSELLAGRDAESADDPRLVERLPLTDEEAGVGALLLGRRSDGNRYNRQELEAVRQIVPALAEALKVSRSRHSLELTMQQRLEEMAARLAQLEGGAPKPA
jgi:hypothetical protein